MWNDRKWHFYKISINTLLSLLLHYISQWLCLLYVDDAYCLLLHFNTRVYYLSQNHYENKLSFWVVNDNWFNVKLNWMATMEWIYIKSNQSEGLLLYNISQLRTNLKHWWLPQLTRHVKSAETNKCQMTSSKKLRKCLFYYHNIT